jgi:hypothetical protein
VIPLPQEICGAEVQRYGFHGLSYECSRSFFSRSARGGSGSNDGGHARRRAGKTMKKPKASNTGGESKMRWPHSAGVSS